MKRRRLAFAVAAAIAIPALGLGLDGAASARTMSPGFYAKQIVVLDCQGHPHVRPGHYTLACADGNDYLSGLAWTSWGPRLASATGTGRQRYTKITELYPGVHPKYVRNQPATFSETLYP